MRQIKFRAWDTEKKEIFSMGMVTSKEGTLVVGGGENKCIIMQFTGLLDKNGKEIYEGDIVIEDGYNSVNISFVEFDDDIGLFTLNCYGGRPFHEMGKLEVIGNIYENHELLPNNT